MRGGVLNLGFMSCANITLQQLDTLSTSTVGVWPDTLVDTVVLPVYLSTTHALTSKVWFPYLVTTVIVLTHDKLPPLGMRFCVFVDTELLDVGSAFIETVFARDTKVRVGFINSD